MAIKSLLLTICIVAVWSIGFSNANAAVVVAKMADSVADGIGVNTHWHYPTYANQGWITILGQSGIRYYRDVCPWTGDAAYQSFVSNMHITYGVRLNGIIGDAATANSLQESEIPSWIDGASKVTSGATPFP